MCACEPGFTCMTHRKQEYFQRISDQESEAVERERNGEWEPWLPADQEPEGWR